MDPHMFVRRFIMFLREVAIDSINIALDEKLATPPSFLQRLIPMQIQGTSGSLTGSTAHFTTYHPQPMQSQARI